VESGFVKMSFKNYRLNEPTIKAIACTIPWIVNLEEIEFENNEVLDHVGSTILMGAFMNPTLKRMARASA
jgi:hypothetical protein